MTIGARGKVGVMGNAVFLAQTLQSSALSRWDYVHNAFRGLDHPRSSHVRGEAREPHP